MRDELIRRFCCELEAIFQREGTVAGWLWVVTPVKARFIVKSMVLGMINCKDDQGVRCQEE